MELTNSSIHNDRIYPNNSRREMSELAVWMAKLSYSEQECFNIFLGFAVSGFTGTVVQLFVLMVFIFKMSRERTKSASDSLFVFLTITDLLACSILFPIECFHFGSGDCNEIDSDFAFGLTVFLEVLSTLALQCITLNRFLLVCRPTSSILTFRRSVGLSIVASAMSVVIVIVVLYWQSNETILLVYTSFIFGNLLMMVILYSAIFARLCQRVNVSRRRNMNRIEMKQRQSQPGPSNIDTDQVQQLTQVTSCTPGDISTNNTNGVTPHSYRSRATPGLRNRTEMEAMRNRSAVISVILTAVYMVCFLPNGTLTLLVSLKPEILTNHPVSILSVKYLQLFYNLNFLLMPFIYSILSQQFRDSSHKFVDFARAQIRNSIDFICCWCC